MKKGVVIADAGPIFSLAIIDGLEILDNVFEEIRIPKAVWEEVTLDKTTTFYSKIEHYFKSKITKIESFNDLTFTMDYGESESIILFKELKADFLLIDDKKARSIAENFDITCIGTLGVLSFAKSKGIIKNLRPLFELFLKNDRYYSIKLLNAILEKHSEQRITFNP